MAETALEQHLIRSGVVDTGQLEVVRAETTANGGGVLEAIVQKGFATEEAAYRALAEFCEMRYVRLSAMTFPESLTQQLPARVATHYEVAPVEERHGTLVVAVSDPMNPHLFDDLRMVLKRRIEAVVATPTEVAAAIKALYGVGAETVERMLSEPGDAANVVNLELADAGANLGDEKIDPSIIKFVNELLMEAIKAGATDVHIEPFEGKLRVRYRIDGILHAVPTPPNIRGFKPAIVSRIKIMANLNIAERRLPQDGKIRAGLSGEQFDLRVSILPTPHGETVNIRILNRSSMFLSLEQLGFHAHDLDLFAGFLKNPHGMILVTGPTGSGKTTTLYAALSKLNEMERKIITIEDPIEYQMDGITQMQTVPQIGFGFSQALRHMLRHDPDIMLVGEIRDYETAEMAVRSSLTGHLVFSTLHTNDAAGAVTRLNDMGVEPFLIASTMIASIAQRLVRRICPHCAQPAEPDPALLEELETGGAQLDGAKFQAGAGCERCRFTGYQGRIAIYEILPFSAPIKQLAIERAPSTEIKRKACGLGMRTLREAGWERVRIGQTTIEEVLRVTADSDAAELLTELGGEQAAGRPGAGMTDTGNAAIPV